MLPCSLDSGVRRNDGVGSAAQSGGYVDSTFALVLDYRRFGQDG